MKVLKWIHRIAFTAIAMHMILIVMGVIPASQLPIDGILLLVAVLLIAITFVVSEIQERRVSG